MAQRRGFLTMILATIFLFSGCVVRTYSVQKERADLDLSSGNRGFLAGKSDAPATVAKTTREIKVVEIEVFPLIKSLKKEKTVSEGVKGKSGPPMNTNAVKHPHRSYMKRRVVPEQYRWVLSPGEKLIEKIKSDLPNMGGKEELAAEGVAMLWTCALLGLAEAKDRGFIVALPGGGWDFQPGLKTAGTFLDRALKGLVSLGLGRRAQLVDELASRVIAMHKDQKDTST